MTLQRTKLVGITSVLGITANPVGIFTAGTSPTPAGVAGTSYIRSVVIHNTSGVHTCGCSVYVTPNGVAASASEDHHKICRVDINPIETYFFECNYPLVLATGDKIAVDVIHPSQVIGGVGYATDTMLNFQVLGDTDL